MKWYVEVPEFEMLIQLDDEGINELKEMINDDVLKLRISANQLKFAMSDEELLEKSRGGMSIGYFPPDDLIDENGVKTEILENKPGITVVDDPFSDVYPMPIDAAGGDDVLVGRIRKDISHPNGIAMWVVCDNLRKGAALNAIQIAEEMMKRDVVSVRNWRK